MKILGSDVNCWVCSDLKTWNCRSLRLYHLYRNGLEWKSKKKINRNCSLQYYETVVHTQGCRVALITQAFFPPFCEITITMSPALFLLIWARGGEKKHHSNKAASDPCCILYLRRWKRFWHSGVIHRYIPTKVQVFRSIAPRCMVYYIESRCSQKKHCYLKVFNWRLHFKTASPAAGFYSNCQQQRT